MTQYSIQHLELANGTCPARDWYESLTPKTRAAVQRRLLQIEKGNFGDHRNFSKGLKELRFNLGPGYRLYCGLEGNTLVLLLCGGDKRTQGKDIKRATKWWLMYTKTNPRNAKKQGGE